MRHIKLFEEFDMAPREDKPGSFVLIVRSGEGQDLEAEVRDEDGKSICVLDQGFLDDGVMQHANDVSGLREYLIGKKKMKQQDVLTVDGVSSPGEEMQATTGHSVSQLSIPTGI